VDKLELPWVDVLAACSELAIDNKGDRVSEDLFDEGFSDRAGKCSFVEIL
jgi:hypothetical protein